MNDLVTIYLAFIDDEPVGCKVKGIKQIVQGSLRTFLSEKTDKMTISFLIVAGTAVAEKSDGLPLSPVFDKVGEATRNVQVDLKELGGRIANASDYTCLV